MTHDDGAARVAQRSAARTAISLARYLAARPVDHVASLSAVLEHGNCFAVYGGEPTATAAAILETLRAR